jgi:hypothetical protein
MTKKNIVFGVALALVIAVIAAPSASAACPLPKTASTYNSGSGAFAYWHPSIVGTSIIGKIWNGTTDYTGTCNESSDLFMYFNAAGDVGMQMNLGGPCVATGCPTGSLSVSATVTDAQGNQQFLTTQAAESSFGFDFSGTAHNMVPAAKQVVTASSPAGTLRNVSVSIPAVSGGLYDGTSGAVTGYNVRSALGTTDPGRDAGAYPTLQTFLPAPGGIATSGTVQVDCSNPAQDRWVVTQLVDASGGAAAVSKATRVNCNSSLADPKFKIVPKGKAIGKDQH